MSLTSRLTVGAVARLVSALDEVTAEAPHNYSYSKDLASGTGDNQADQVFSDERTLAASATENLDLAGVLVDALGATLTFAKVRAIIIRAADANTNDVVVGGHATAAFATPFGDVTDKVKVKPGGIFVLIAPKGAAYAVTATTADMLKIENSAGSTSVTYEVIIIGCSA